MRIKIRQHRGLSLRTLMMNVAMFCVVSLALLEAASISVPVVSMFKTPMMYLGALCIICQFFYFTKRLKKKRFFYMFLSLLLLCAMLIVAALGNPKPKLGDESMPDTVRLVLYLVELFFVAVWIAEEGAGKKLLDFIFYYMLILTVATDLLLFSRVITFTDGHFETYLVGTKFTVSYFHMNLMTLWYVRNRQRFHSDKKARRILYLGMPVALLVAVRVDCISGIIGCLVLLVLFLIMDKPIQKQLLKLTSPGAMLIVLAVSVIFPFVSESILDIPFITYIIENVLGRDNRLTGRLNIFQEYGKVMQEHWLWGYGYGNGNIVSVTLFGYENSQNALLHWVLQVGIPAGVCLVLYMTMVFHQLSKSSVKQKCMPFVALIYMYIVLGMIETTFSMSFLLWFGVIFMIIKERTPQQKLKGNNA